ncbi:MAG: DnaJ domain-containing protein [Deltaproteobacteria bacterium]|jgi:curved DNA-binding protein|nr:DnaJ domain-containing protein [Deltaproteobacteria bacterium]
MPAVSRKDYYTILQVSPEADPGELKKAYRRLAVLWHPDRNPGSQMAEERFKAVAEAYAVLSDPLKRKRYDEVGHETFAGEFQEKDIFRGFELSDLFKEFGLPDSGDTLERLLDLDPAEERDAGRAQDFFGGFGQGKGERRSGLRKKAADMRTRLFVSLKEAVYGARRLTAFNTPAGAVKATVDIPPGTEDGAIIPLKGKVPGGKNEEGGDLILTVKILPDKNFSRQGSDILTKLSLSARDLKEGANPVLGTLDGKTIRISVPPGTLPGARLKVAGRGVPRGASRGSLIVRVTLKDPPSA